MRLDLKPDLKRRDRTASGHLPARSDLEMKIRLLLCLGLLGLVLVILVRLLLPILILASIAAGTGAAVYWWWRYQQKKQRRQQRQQARLNGQFYQLLQQRQGQISVLDFAMCTQLDGTAAQAYLNAQAQSFSAYCEPTPHGDAIYIFNLATVNGGSPHHRVAQAEAAWAEAERAQEKRTQTAWANAKQLRTLRQLSQPSPQLTADKAPSEPAKKAIAKIALPANQRPDRQALPYYFPSSDRAPKSISENISETISKTNPADTATESADDIPSPPVARGRAFSTPDCVVTIEVPAVRS